MPVLAPTATATITPQYAGTAITTTVNFTNPPSGTLTDPSTVELKYRISGGSTTTWTYGGAGGISRVNTGIYAAELDTTDLPGDWVIQWRGTGACAATNVATFLVLPKWL